MSERINPLFSKPEKVKVTASASPISNQEMQAMVITSLDGREIPCEIDFEKLNIRKSLKLKPYNSNNIYDKNFWGIFMFSRIMFDHTGKEALIEVRSTTKENNDNDKLIHLKKNENNEWTIVGRDILVPENSNYYEKYP